MGINAGLVLLVIWSALCLQWYGYGRSEQFGENVVVIHRTTDRTTDLVPACMGPMHGDGG
jgi:hypothetical protein